MKNIIHFICLFLFIVLLQHQNSLLAQRTHHPGQKSPAKLNESIPADNPFNIKKRGHMLPKSDQSAAHTIKKGKGLTSGAQSILHTQAIDIGTYAKKSEGIITDIYQDSSHSIPYYIVSQHANREALTFYSKSEIESIAYEYLTDLRGKLPFSDPQSQLRLTNIQKDELGHVHVKFQQVIQGVPVFGSEAKVHFSDNGKRIFHGRLENPIDEVSIHPRLTEEQAIQLIQNKVKSDSTHKNFSNTKNIFGLRHVPEAQLMFYPDRNRADVLHLVYEVEIYTNIKDHWYYYVDANSAEIIDSANHTCTFLPPSVGSGTNLRNQNVRLNTFQDGNNFYLIDASQQMFKGSPNQLPEPGAGAIVTLDLRNDIDGQLFLISSGDNQNWDPTGVSAHFNAMVSYQYFEQVHNHMSINGQGGDMLSIINYPDPETGEGFDNAFWNGQFIGYGNGNVIARLPLAGALDIGAHEMTHGVIEATANLLYQGQSGALNESFADVFGVLIEREDYLLGEDVMNPQVFPSGALRDMANPNNGAAPGQPGWQPKDMSEFQDLPLSVNNGGVHTNSGIPNRAFFLITDAIGANKSEVIYFRALSQYLTRNSQFIDCRLAVIQSAEDLFGPGSLEVQAAAEAFNTVGIGGPDVEEPVEEEPERFPVNPGSQFILFTDTDEADANTLYTYDIQRENFIALSQTPHNRPVSVSDDGTLGIMIDSNEKIRLLDLNPLNPDEDLVESTISWTNAVLSKDGTKLAAVTNEEDALIWVFDLVRDTIVAFELFNPTTGIGISTNEVLFADALEWDHTSQVLMFDSFNRISSFFGDGLEYWDVGFIEVWDNEREEFGSGNIFNLFTNLPEGVSVGNATFSKNSPQLIAFDRFDENDFSYTLMTANIETGEVVEAFDNQVLSFPSFSTQDNLLLFSAQDNNGTEVVASIELAEDGINVVNNSAGIVFSRAKWPVWYATGSRNLEGPISTSNNDLLTVVQDIEAYPVPTLNELSVRYSLTESASIEIRLSDLSGKLIRPLAPAHSAYQGNHLKVFDIGDIASGMYLLEVLADGRRSTLKIVKQ